jgi:hypothetical protein
MKALVALIILLSIFMGVPTNKGWFNLYGEEFLAPISIITNKFDHSFNFILWFPLLITHALVVSLVFFTKKQFFWQLLFWFPFLFIMMFTLFDLVGLLFLIPFIIVWIIALIKQNYIDKQHVIKTRML